MDSSWVLKQFLDLLTGGEAEAEEITLRKTNDMRRKTGHLARALIVIFYYLRKEGKFNMFLTVLGANLYSQS